MKSADITSAREIAAMDLPEKVTVDLSDRKEKQAEELKGVVKNWQEGLLKVISADREITLLIDPTIAMVYVPSRETKGLELLVTDKTAFIGCRDFVPKILW